MGLLDSLRNLFTALNQPVFQTNKETTYNVVQKQHSVCTPSFTFPNISRFYEEAFNSITAKIYAKPNTFSNILPAAAQAFASGDIKAGKKIFEALGRYEWNWPEYEQWFETFAAKGEWPYAWERYPGVCLPEGPPDKPNEETYVRFLKFMKVSEVKNLAKKAGLSVPAKAIREEIDALIINRLTISQLREIEPEKIQSVTEQYQEYRQKHIAYLLQHTITTTAYHIRDLSQMGETSYSLSSFEFLDSECPVEKTIVKEKSKIKPLPMPPFFPGDTSALVMRQKRRR